MWNGCGIDIKNIFSTNDCREIFESVCDGEGLEENFLSIPQRIFKKAFRGLLQRLLKVPQKSIRPIGKKRKQILFLIFFFLLHFKNSY